MHLHMHSEGSSDKTIFRLKLAAIATFIFVFAEVAASAYSHSLSLFSDAMSNLVDGLTLLAAWWGVWLATRPADRRHTFGYNRATVVIALLNACFLMPVIIGIGYQAVERYLHPVNVDGTIIGIAGLAGLICNVSVACALKSVSNQLSVRGAFLHNLSDAAASVLILVSGFIISYTGAAWVDLILSACICAVLVWSLVPIVKRSIHILLEGAPDGADPDTVSKAILHFSEVTAVHDIHTWIHGDDQTAVTCHIVVRAGIAHEQDDEIVNKVRTMLKSDFGLAHSTIQLERNSCDEAGGCL